MDGMLHACQSCSSLMYEFHICAFCRRSLGHYSRSVARSSAPRRPRGASTLADAPAPAWQPQSSPPPQQHAPLPGPSNAFQSETAAAALQPGAASLSGRQSSGGQGSGGGQVSSAPGLQRSASQSRVPPLRLAEINPAPAAPLPPILTTAATVAQCAVQGGAAAGADPSGLPAADKRIPGRTLSQSSSRSAALGSLTDDSGVLGLERSISHRQLSLGCGLSFDAAPAATAAADQLPRLPSGAFSDVPSLGCRPGRHS